MGGEENGTSGVNAKPRVLLVEDEPLIAEALEDLIAALGCVVIALVDSGEQAVAVAEARLPDVVIMDVQLAGSIDGIDAAQQIRERSRVPIVFTTASRDPVITTRAAQIERATMIRKPFDANAFAAALERAVDLALGAA